MVEIVCYSAPIIEKLGPAEGAGSKVLSKIGETVTLRPVVVALVEPALAVLVGATLLGLALMAWEFASGRVRLRTLYEAMPGYLPVLLWVCALVIGNLPRNSAQGSGIEVPCMVFLVLLAGWCVHLALLQPNPLCAHHCLNKPRELACMGVFVFLSLAGSMPRQAFLATALVLHLGLLGWHLLAIGYPSEEVERARIVGVACCVVAELVEVLSGGGGPDLLVVTLLAAVAYIIGFVEMLLEVRWRLLVNNTARVREMPAWSAIAIVYFLLENERQGTYEASLEKRKLSGALLEIGHSEAQISALIEQSTGDVI